MKIDYIAEAITEAFGERCPEFAAGCHCCEAWKQYDEVGKVKIRRVPRPPLLLRSD